ncbi:MAG: type III-B CRISPR module RAMP protein Cmr6 [Deltaproteobacteria bacterium]|nr:type III-B CRISPR module RAMP protein Cmr6 [Deltaproteobacteria bacterium]
MPIPVSAALTAVIQQCNLSRIHPGLLFNRYLSWPKEWDFGGEEKARCWEQIAKAISQVSSEVYDFIDQRQQKLRDLIAAIYPGGTTLNLTLNTRAPLVVGLGGNSPLENAITLHPLWGIPYLPASGLKGVMRHYLEENYSDDFCNNQAKELIDNFFGSPIGTGRLILLDAFPAHPLCFDQHIRVDILNNHYPGYYLGEGADLEAPGDYQDPRPVYFLSLGLKVQFKLYFYLKPLSLSNAKSLPGELILAEFYCNPDKFCKYALEEMAMGAKTNVGYGWVEVQLMET